MDAIAIMSYLSKYGLLCIFIIILLEYLNLPGFPGGIIMPLAGVWTASTGNNLFIAVLLSVLAGLIGSWILYMVGLYGGNFLLDKYVNKFPSHGPMIDKCMARLRKHGNTGVFICRLLPAVRTVIAVPAGVLKLNFIRYTVGSIFGILIWNGVLMSIGYFCSDMVMRNIA